MSIAIPTSGTPDPTHPCLTCGHPKFEHHADGQLSVPGPCRFQPIPSGKSCECQTYEGPAQPPTL